MKANLNNSRGILAAIVVLASVVSSQCSQSQTGTPTAPSAGSLGSQTSALGDPTDATPVAGVVKVCKSVNSNVSGTFTVASTAPASVAVISPVTVAPGACTIVGLHIIDAAFVSVVETSAGFVSATATTEAAVTTAYNNGDGLRINQFHGFTVSYVNSVVVAGDEGCTPGYWRQSQHLDSWAGYATDADFDATFGVNFFNPNITLLQAVSQGGGGTAALGRHAVAALLNTANSGVAYPYTTAQVLDIVQGDGAYWGLNYTQRKNLLEAANELGCPLN